jgi:quinol monooxygenase YgiN
MEPFLKATPPTMAIGFDLTHYTEVSGFLDKSGRAAECAVIYDTKIVCASAFARDTILSRLESIAEHAEGEESGTYTFWVLRSLENEEEVRIFERYESWEALELHQKAPGLINFWLDSKEEVRSMEGRAYAPNLKGWLNRSVQRSDPIIDRVGNELSFVHH